MQIEMWPISRPQPYPGNPRLNDGAVAAVADSLREFGWQQPLVVDTCWTCLEVAEHAGRKALLMELNPLYRDLISRRYETFSGKKGERLDATAV